MEKNYVFGNGNMDCITGHWISDLDAIWIPDIRVGRMLNSRTGQIPNIRKYVKNPTNYRIMKIRSDKTEI